MCKATTSWNTITLIREKKPLSPFLELKWPSSLKNKTNKQTKLESLLFKIALCQVEDVIGQVVPEKKIF